MIVGICAKYLDFVRGEDHYLLWFTLNVASPDLLAFNIEGTPDEPSRPDVEDGDNVQNDLIEALPLAVAKPPTIPMLPVGPSLLLLCSSDDPPSSNMSGALLGLMSQVASSAAAKLYPGQPDAQLRQTLWQDQEFKDGHPVNWVVGQNWGP